MTDPFVPALFDYGLFLAKTLTLVAAALALIVLLLGVRRHTQEEGARIEIRDLNARFQEFVDTVKAATLPRAAYRAYLKAERKAEKAREKAGPQERSRLFLIAFKGDIRASEVSALRLLVSTLVLECRPGDEVLVRLDNAGGLVNEHGLAAAQLARLRAQGIRLTVAVDKIAASGGYLMAAVADRILAAPFAVVGSIGVLAELPNFHRLLERHGVDFELHTAGEHKRTLTLFGENTEEGRAKLRQQLEETHQLFKQFVLEYRPQIDLERVATGEYWHGEQAVALGLVDEIRTSDDYLLAALPEREVYELTCRTHKKPVERVLSAMRAGLDALAARGWRF